LNINDVHFALEQELVLTTGSHTFRHTYTLTNQQKPGVAARGTNEAPIVMGLDLKTVKYTPPENRKKKGKYIPWSSEDFFMMSNMQAKCSG
jgi:hypothetical protein